MARTLRRPVGSVADVGPDGSLVAPESVVSSGHISPPAPISGNANQATRTGILFTCWETSRTDEVQWSAHRDRESLTKRDANDWTRCGSGTSASGACSWGQGSMWTDAERGVSHGWSVITMVKKRRGTSRPIG